MRYLVTLFLSLIVSTAFGQKLVKDEVDKFNKSHIKETSSEKLAYDIHTGNRIKVTAQSVANQEYYKLFVFLSVRTSSIRSTKKGSTNAYVVTTGGQTITLQCVKGDVASYHDGVWYITSAYGISSIEDTQTLMDEGITDIRIRFRDATITMPIKEKRQMLLSKMLKLVQPN